MLSLRDIFHRIFRHRASTLLGGLLAMGALIVGCRSAPSFDVAPPSVQLRQGAGIGQGLWLEDRVLAPVHVVSESEELPGSLWLHGRRVTVLDARGGAYRQSDDIEDASRSIAEDWAVLTVDAVSPAEPSRVRAGDGRVRAGETLYLVGYDPLEKNPGLTALGVRVLGTSVTVVDGETRHPLPSNVIPVRQLSRPGAGPGWSGSFVGRYERRPPRWTYVGQVTNVLADVETGATDVLTVVRPPEEVVRWFFEGADP